jgi:hypothetical protein
MILHEYDNAQRGFDGNSKYQVYLLYIAIHDFFLSMVNTDYYWMLSLAMNMSSIGYGIIIKSEMFFSLTCSFMVCRSFLC